MPLNYQENHHPQEPLDEDYFQGQEWTLKGKHLSYNQNNATKCLQTKYVNFLKDF